MNCLESPDRIERRDSLRKLQRLDLAASSQSHDATARYLGMTRQVMDRQLEDGDGASLAAADLVLWSRKFGRRLLETIVRACGGRFVPHVETATASDVLGAASA